MRIGLLFLTALIVCGAPGSEPARILTNHLGYDPFGPKRAVIRGTAADEIQSFAVRTYPDEALVYKGSTASGTGVDRWKKWQFWSLDFTDVQREGTYIIDAQDRDRTVRSFPFKIQKNILERFTISDVLFYFKGQRKSGLFDQAVRNLAFQGSDR